MYKPLIVLFIPAFLFLSSCKENAADADVEAFFPENMRYVWQETEIEQDGFGLYLTDTEIGFWLYYGDPTNCYETLVLGELISSDGDQYTIESAEPGNNERLIFTLVVSNEKLLFTVDEMQASLTNTGLIPTEISPLCSDGTASQKIGKKLKDSGFHSLNSK